MKALRIFRMFLTLGFIVAMTKAHSSPISAVKSRIAVALASVQESLAPVLANPNLNSVVQAEASQPSQLKTLDLGHQLERLWNWTRKQSVPEQTRGSERPASSLR
jgi:hypothetical protein